MAKLTKVYVTSRLSLEVIPVPTYFLANYQVLCLYKEEVHL